MISAQQGQEILNAAVLSGEWTYSQNNVPFGEPPVDYANHVGDCSDYCRNAVSSGLKGQWAGGKKANTAAFGQGKAEGFTQVDLSAAQPGDMVVQGSHMGVYAGRTKSGTIVAWENGGRPASGPNLQGYRDGRTQGGLFATDGSGWFGTAPITIYRALKKTP